MGTLFFVTLILKYVLCVSAEEQVVRSGTVFLEQTQIVIAESSAVVRLFSPFPAEVKVDVSELNRILSSVRIAQGVMEENGVKNPMQLEACGHKLIRAESIFLNETEWLVREIEIEKRSADTALRRVKDRAFSFSPGWVPGSKISGVKLEREPRAAILIPALALGAGMTAGHILGSSIKQAGCSVMSIFNMCSDKKNQQAIDQMDWKVNYMGQSIQRLQSTTAEMAFLLGSEVRKTQEAVNKVQELVDKNFLEVARVIDRIRDEQIRQGFELVCQKKYGEYLAKFNQWQSSVSNFTNYLLLVHTNIKAYHAGVVGYEYSIYSALNILSKGFLSPSLITPDQLQAVLIEVVQEEALKNSHFQPALSVQNLASYYELELVKEVVITDGGVHIELQIPLNEKSGLFHIYQAVPIHQPIPGTKTASLFKFEKEFFAISRDRATYSELSVSDITQCKGNSQVRLCERGFSLTRVSSSTCLSSLFFNLQMSAFKLCLSTTVNLPEIPSATYLLDSTYHVVAASGDFVLKNFTEGMQIVGTERGCRSCLIRPGCRSRLESSSGHMILMADPKTCGNQGASFFSQVELTPPLDSLVRLVTAGELLSLPSLTGQMREQLIEGVRMELAELEADKLTILEFEDLAKPLVDGLREMHIPISTRLQAYTPWRVSLAFSVTSLTLSLFWFLANYLLFHRQWRVLFRHPWRLLTKRIEGKLIFVTDRPLDELNEAVIALTSREMMFLKELVSAAGERTEDLLVEEAVASAPGHSYTPPPMTSFYPDVTTERRKMKTMRALKVAGRAAIGRSVDRV